MPTGYTAKLQDGATFEQFVLCCANAFLPNFSWSRSLPHEIPDKIVPMDSYKKLVMDAQEELFRIMNMTPEVREQAAANEWQMRETNRLAILESRRRIRSLYEDARRRVAVWDPPTKDHEKLKQFMLDQINLSIDDDCDEQYYSNPVTPMTADEWLMKKISKLTEDINYFTTKHLKEVDSAKKQTEWIRELKKSLGV